MPVPRTAIDEHDLWHALTAFEIGCQERDNARRQGTSFSFTAKPQDMAMPAATEGVRIGRAKHSLIWQW